MGMRGGHTFLNLSSKSYYCLPLYFQAFLYLLHRSHQMSLSEMLCKMTCRQITITVLDRCYILTLCQQKRTYCRQGSKSGEDAIIYLVTVQMIRYGIMQCVNQSKGIPLYYYKRIHKMLKLTERVNFTELQNSRLGRDFGGHLVQPFAQAGDSLPFWTSESY